MRRIAATFVPRLLTAGDQKQTPLLITEDSNNETTADPDLVSEVITGGEVPRAWHRATFCFSQN